MHPKSLYSAERESERVARGKGIVGWGAEEGMDSERAVSEFEAVLRPMTTEFVRPVPVLPLVSVTAPLLSFQVAHDP